MQAVPSDYKRLIAVTTSLGLPVRCWQVRHVGGGVGDDFAQALQAAL